MYVMVIHEPNMYKIISGISQGLILAKKVHLFILASARMIIMEPIIHHISKNNKMFISLSLYVNITKIIVKFKSNYAAIARFTRLSNASSHSL